jgi:hypothetical protein
VRPEDLEDDLAAHGEVAVVAAGSGLMVYAASEDAEIASRCRLLCREWALPQSAITVVPTRHIPCTRTGKIDYGALT